MRLNLLLGLLPLVAVCAAPLACSSSAASDDSAANNDDGGDGTDDGGDQTGDGGGSNPDGGSTGPFTPGPYPGTYPQVPNNGGGVMANFKLVVIVPSNETANGPLDFGSSFTSSNTFKAVASEYGLGAPTSMTIAGPAMSAQEYSTSQVQSYITSAISGKVTPNANTIFLVFMPATAWIGYDQDGTEVSEKGCHANDDPNAGGVGGYHVPYNAGGGWAVVQHCTGDPTHTDSQIISISASHEVIEAATDVDGQSGYSLPVVQQPSDWTSNSIWDDLLLTEIGDLCVNTEINEGSFTYQRFWSNKAAANSADPCIPAISTYFNTGTVGSDTNGWFKMTGTSMTIPVEGFSTAALAPWIFASATGTSPAQATVDGWTISVTGTGTTAGEQTIGNGDKGSVTITAPSGLQSGDFAGFELVSEATTNVPGGESYHIWPFGVYVP
jgi:hypothetical protein